MRVIDKPAAGGFIIRAAGAVRVMPVHQRIIEANVQTFAAGCLVVLSNQVAPGRLFRSAIVRQFCIEVAEALMMFGGHYHVFHARLLGEFCPGARGMRLRVENFRELLVFGDRNPFLFHGPLVPSEHAVKPEMDEHSETRFVPPFHAAVAISDSGRGRPGVLRLCKQGCGRYRRNRGCRAEGAEQAASGNVNFAGHSFCCITIRKRVLAVIGTTSDYSYRSASVGFRLAARFAGSMPNPTPTDTEAAKAITMERDEIGIL